jgi:SAM-dependent methyltransferase
VRTTEQSIAAYDVSQRVKTYDADMELMHPNRSKMVQVAIEVLPFPRTAALRAIDLGIGTGYFTKQFLNHFPNSRVLGIDGAQAMVELAKARLRSLASRLARIARMEPALLYPVRHGSEQAQQDLLRIKLRDSLVRARVGMINSLRFTLKSLGYTIVNPSTERFHKVIEGRIPEPVGRVIAPSVRALEELSLQIKLLDREIIALARSKYPNTAWLEQIPGVGPISLV